MTSSDAQPAVGVRVPVPETEPTDRTAGTGGPVPGDLRSRTVNSAFWVAADKWVNRLASLVVFAVIGRLLDPSDIGVAALAATFVALFQVFAEQGFSDALVQRKELDREHPESAFWVSLGSSALLAGLLVAFAGPIARALGAPELAPVLQVLCVTLPLAALSLTPAALLQRDFGFKRLTQRRVVANLLGGVVGVVVALLGGGVWAIVAQSITSAAVGVVVLWAVLPWRPRLRVSWRAVRDLRGVGLSVIGIQLFAFVNAQADKFVIGAFISPTALGYYYVGTRIIGILSDVQTAVIQSVSLTALSRVQDDMPRFRRAFLSLTAASAVIGVFTYATFAALAPVVVPLVFGTQWERSVPVAQILCVMGALNSVLVFDRTALIAAGRSRLALLITAVQCVVGVAAVLVSVPWGVIAVAVAVTARQYLVWPLRLRALRSALGLSLIAYLRQWAAPALAGLAVFGTVSGAFALLPAAGSLWAQLGMVAGGGLGALLVYLGLGLLLFRGTLTDLTSVARGRRSG
ncbi:Polysaccharide biosynthesis protein [Modestobacter italicus]|uniref:Polysaccharide biosynthesis protein n=1 Tax=Modestobacter italicus (strain DSM 44449 / CECT 9708 / BC 501) TaxID=2732864 RepID=I4ERA2_MODI5|nr:lipopolysaccharide biosynthesis protein [Modestobacter marinus]CCH85915.1 Polysaccharide biosynthesis protein [Modestobacter marinus]